MKLIFSLIALLSLPAAFAEILSEQQEDKRIAELRNILLQPRNPQVSPSESISPVPSGSVTSSAAASGSVSQTPTSSAPPISISSLPSVSLSSTPFASSSSSSLASENPKTKTGAGGPRNPESVAASSSSSSGNWAVPTAGPGGLFALGVGAVVGGVVM